MLLKDSFSGSHQEQIATYFCQVYFTFDLEKQQFIYLNPAVENILARRPVAIIENPAILLDYLHPEDQEYVHAEYQNLMQGQVKRR
ncbi:PAS domain-containing protein [Adhaeribacter pallidiroseus]|nr:PAS domain-containing protein [Adhaeribacter pallidiroseus]